MYFSRTNDPLPSVGTEKLAVANLRSYSVKFFGKDIIAKIPTSGFAAQWIKAQVGNRKLIDFQF